MDNLRAPIKNSETLEALDIHVCVECNEISLLPILSALSNDIKR